MGRKNQRTQRLNDMKDKIDSIILDSYRGGAEELTLNRHQLSEITGENIVMIYNYNLYGHLDLRYSSAHYHNNKGKVTFDTREWLKERAKEVGNDE